LGGQVRTPREEFAGHSPPGKLIALCIGNGIVSAFLTDTLVEAEQIDVSAPDLRFAIQKGPIETSVNTPTVRRRRANRKRTPVSHDTSPIYP
jgi:hypothetical protein